MWQVEHVKLHSRTDKNVAQKNYLKQVKNIKNTISAVGLQ